MRLEREIIHTVVVDDPLVPDIDEVIENNINEALVGKCHLGGIVLRAEVRERCIKGLNILTGSSSCNYDVKVMIDQYIITPGEMFPNAVVESAGDLTIARQSLDSLVSGVSLGIILTPSPDFTFAVGQSIPVVIEEAEHSPRGTPKARARILRRSELASTKYSFVIKDQQLPSELRVPLEKIREEVKLAKTPTLVLSGDTAANIEKFATAPAGSWEWTPYEGLTNSEKARGDIAHGILALEQVAAVMKIQREINTVHPNIDLTSALWSLVAT